LDDKKLKEIDKEFENKIAREFGVNRIDDKC